MKKSGGNIKNWQTHTISKKPEDLIRTKELYPEFEMDTVMVFTGTVITDPSGRWKEDWHMRSSLILKHDKATGIVETQNSIYTLQGEEGGDSIGDLGPNIMNIFY